MTRYLDALYDPVLEVDVTLTPEQVTAQERDRLVEQCSIVLAASKIPRRLSEANSRELALDKKRARRVAHVLTQSLIGWSTEQAEVGEPATEHRQRGAQLYWPDWWAEHEAWLIARRRYLATWAKRTNNGTFGKQALVRLSNELEWLEYAMRDD